jgi:hypothetical protein
VRDDLCKRCSAAIGVHGYLRGGYWYHYSLDCPEPLARNREISPEEAGFAVGALLGRSLRRFILWIRKR